MNWLRRIKVAFMRWGYNCDNKNRPHFLRHDLIPRGVDYSEHLECKWCGVRIWHG